MAAVLRIGRSDAPAHAQHGDVKRLARLLSARRDIKVSRPEAAPTASGEKGAALEVGMLILSFATPEAIGTLIDGLRLFFDGKPGQPEFGLEISDEAGKRTLKLTSKDFSPSQIMETAAGLKELGLFAK